MKNNILTPPRVILGIDPGSVCTGYGVLEVSEGKQIYCRASGLIELAQQNSDAAKLHHLYQSIQQLITQYRVGELAIEQPFMGLNAKSFFKLSRAQGVIIAAAAAFDMPIFEYAPRTVKASTSGRGGSAKATLHQFLEQILNQAIIIKKYDATDALAVAFCHFQRTRTQYKGSDIPLLKTVKKKKASWATFLQHYPGRIHI